MARVTNPDRWSLSGEIRSGFLCWALWQVSLAGWRAEGRTSSAETRLLPQAEDATINREIDNLLQRLITASSHHPMDEDAEVKPPKVPAFQVNLTSIN